MGFRWMALLGVSAVLLPLAAQAQNNAQQDFERLSTATALDRPGMVPWHLRMSFKSNGLSGKPEESGTIEEWWVSPGNRRLVITSPSYSSPSPLGTQQVPSRESYLVQELLRQVVHPVSSYGSSEDLRIEEHEQMSGNLKFTCLYVGRSTAKSLMTDSSPMYCAEPGTNVLRFSSSGNHEPFVIRYQMGDFLNTSVAIKTTIVYGNQIAISGKVEVLETYKPDASSVLATRPSDEGHDPAGASTRVSGTVLAGKILKKVAPSYPEVAKYKNIGGTVMLGAIISKSGTISTLYVIASSDESLSVSALEAVKQWKYQPYLLNGVPTEVDTTITVNFNLNHF